MSPPDHRFSYEEEKRGFFQKYGFAIGLVAALVIVAILGTQVFSKSGGSARKAAPDMVMIKPVAPPPAPPPPPPPQQQPQEQKMMQQEEVTEEDTKPPEAPQDASPNLGTGIVGNGPPDAFGLSGKGGNGFFGSNNGGSRGGSRFGWYAAKVIRQFQDALTQNPRTRIATFSIEVRIWADSTGHITRAKLAHSTQNRELDEAIKNEILRGSLADPPPDDMPMPIVVRFNARRPN